MQLTHTPNTPAAIWDRLLGPDQSDMSPEDELVVRNQEGKLTSEEQDELKNYRQVGLQVDLLRAKAMLTLKQRARSY